MAYIRCVKDDNYYQYYRCIDMDTDEIYVIGAFLTSDVRSFSKDYREWCLDGLTDHCGGNITTLEKEDGFIIVSDTYSQDDDGGPYVKILPREFVNLLDQWQQVFEQQPKEIIITEIDGVYAVEGRN